MFSTYLIWISVLALILGGTCYLIGISNESFKLEIIALLFLGLSLIGGLGAIIEKEVALNTSSTNYYYNMLEKKTFIEEELKSHKKEIDALRTGEVDGVVFKNRNEIVKLNNAIERYNNIILLHLEYKDNKWHKERFNENVSKLKPFEKIF